MTHSFLSLSLLLFVVADMHSFKLFLAETLVLLAVTLSATAKVVEQTFDIGWVWANPDGRHARPVISVNGVWPPPTIHVDIGVSSARLDLFCQTLTSVRTV